MSNADAKSANETQTSADLTKKVVIIGGGHGGGQAAIKLRENGYRGEITILGTEERAPYERPGLSKGFLQGDEEEDDLYLQPASGYEENQVTRHAGVQVTKVDTDNRTVTFHKTAVADGKASGDVQNETVDYETLILATGSEPRELDLPNANAQNVLYLRSVEDSKRLKTELAAANRVVIIGAGWIGLEVAAAARKANCAVTVINRDSEPLIGPLGETLAKLFAELHREHGVILRNDTQVTKLIGTDDRVAAVETDGGDQISADLVIAGIGAAPRLDLAEQMGLEVEGGVKTDAQLRTSDPNVYAVGDIASVYSARFDRHIRLDHWAAAMRQPETLAKVLCGEDARYDRLPYFFTDQYDLGSEYVGYVPDELREEIEVVIRGDMRKREVIAFFVYDHKIWAGMNINIWDVSEDVERLILTETPITRDQLEQSDLPLSELGKK